MGMGFFGKKRPGFDDMIGVMKNGGVPGAGYGGFDTGSSFENPPALAPEPPIDSGPPPDTGFGGMTGKPAAPSASDPRSVFSSIYQGYGLDPNNPTGLKSELANVDYFLTRMGQTGGWTPGNASYWQDRLKKEIELAQQGLGNQQEAGSGGGLGAAGSVFTDPATSEWESMLRGLVGKLNVPDVPEDYGAMIGQLRGLSGSLQKAYTPEDYGPMLEQLRSYNKELQGPAYTPNEMDLLQTQAIDPLMASRDAVRQQTLQRLASRGIDPNSGVAQELLSNVDRGFAGQEAQTRAGFAAQGIERTAQRKQQAAGLAQLIPQLEQGLHGTNEQRALTAAQLGMLIPQLQRGQSQYNEGRALQGLGLMGQIQALADRRLAAAQGTLQSPNAMMGLYGLLAQLAQQQGQYNQGRQGDFWQMLAQLLPGAFR